MQNTTFRDLNDRLMCDSQFKALVDQMYCLMVSQKVAPYELRDAAYMASIQFAQMNIEPRMISARFPEDAIEILRSVGCRTKELPEDWEPR